MTDINGFAETSALVAVIDEDEERLVQVLDGMLPGELQELAANAEELADRARQVARAKSREGAPS